MEKSKVKTMIAKVTYRGLPEEVKIRTFNFNCVSCNNENLASVVDEYDFNSTVRFVVKTCKYCGTNNRITINDIIGAHE